MNRLSLLTLIILFIVSLSNCGGSAPSSDSKVAEKISSPNIVYILADDLGYGDLSCYGQQNFTTPNIDRLAAGGMKFTQHYSGSTVCAPSRSALLTGQHTGHTFIRGNAEIQPEGQYPLKDSIVTLPEVLKQQGYVTGAFGKWGLGYPGSEGDPINQGFDQFFGYNCQRMGHHYYPHHLWSNKDSVVLAENSGFQKNNYAPELIHQKSLEFIRENQSSPFFLYIPSIIPHAELIAPDSVMEKYIGKFEPETPFSGYDEGPDYRRGPYESQEHPHAAFVAMIKTLDRQVGEIIDLLEELGLAENTLIVFTSDNGPHLEAGADPEYFDSNGPLKGFKRDLYEGGIRVPMVAYWKGNIKPGTETDHISAFWDIFPTVSELAGVSPPGNLDGISFVPTLFDQKELQEKHEYLYWEFHEKGGRIAVRKDQWKAVKYDVLEQPDAPMELYDLSKDLGEENNVAGEYPEVVAEMRQIFRKARTSSEIFTFQHQTYLAE